MLCEGIDVGSAELDLRVATAGAPHPYAWAHVSDKA